LYVSSKYSAIPPKKFATVFLRCEPDRDADDPRAGQQRRHVDAPDRERRDPGGDEHDDRPDVREHRREVEARAGVLHRVHRAVDDRGQRPPPDEDEHRQRRAAQESLPRGGVDRQRVEHAAVAGEQEHAGQRRRDHERQPEFVDHDVVERVLRRPAEPTERADDDPLDDGGGGDAREDDDHGATVGGSVFSADVTAFMRPRGGRVA
jgi:hypothetical protein